MHFTVKAAVTQQTDGSTDQQLAGALTVNSNICYTFPPFKDCTLGKSLLQETYNKYGTYK